MKDKKLYQVIKAFDGHRTGARITPEQITGSELRELALQAQGVIRLVAPVTRPTPTSTPPVNLNINLNTATRDELESLSGVGEHRAGLILNQRPFSDPETAIALYPFLRDTEGWVVL